MSDKHSMMGERLTTGDLGDFEEFEGFEELSPKRTRFVCEYLKDGNATQAAIRAGYSEHTAQSQSSDLLSKPMVRRAIAQRMRAAAVAAGVDAAMVVAEIHDLAFADRSEVMELLVRPCPLCWPAGLTLEDPNPLCAPQLLVGTGSDQRNVGGCGGVGVQSVKLTPTRKLSRQAAKLINSIRQKKDGSIEIEMFYGEKAIEMLGRACGVFKDIRELSGPGGGPVPLEVAPALLPHSLTNEELEAILRKNGRPVPPRTIEGATGQ